MKTKVAIAVILAGAAGVAAVVFLHPFGKPAGPVSESPSPNLSSLPPEEPPPSDTMQPVSAPDMNAVVEDELITIPAPAEQPAASTNKLERLAKIRETFRAFAAGDRTTAVRAAKQITDETERETALLTLVTEWTQGELGTPRRRAHLIDVYGLEAGLGFELAKDPELAVLWANELVDGPARVDLLQQIARGLMGTDPAAAFALSQQAPEEYRRQFSDALFANWGGKDTAAALHWAEQLPDPTEQEVAIQAIRTEAPVGIGAVLATQEGYPIVKELLAGTPVALGGQIRAGDRIVALAQGNNAFMDAHNVALEEIVKMVRGQPGTLLQLQVLSADALPGSAPKTVTIVRDQIKFKR